MARRRDQCGNWVDPGLPPAELLSMRGVAAFLDPDEPVPVWVSAARADSWRAAGAFGRWLQARRRWCEDNGVGYADTFQPGWRASRGNQ
jgi:hypothetical protein